MTDNKEFSQYIYLYSVIFSYTAAQVKRTNTILILALVAGLFFHGSALFFTLESTYDALIHLFFADHYAENWFEPWDYRWYTGFTVMSYPPLVHQAMALLSFLGGLKFGLYAVALLGIVLFITGVYRFSYLLLGNSRIAGYAALLAVCSSAFIETLHLFGQLPSIIGLSVLLHALPEIYLWLTTGKYRYFFTSLSLIAVTVTSHHVTPIFGMVFFIFPLVGLVVMDRASKETGDLRKVNFISFFLAFKKLFKRIMSFGAGALFLIVSCILPYWINTKNNPITQVPIPHGSRDNFFEVTSSGLVFFLVPWGVLLLLVPYLFYRFYSKRYLFFGLSISLLTLLGTGGTTPIPKGLLGENAFTILTLDRFTLWATIMALPLFGELMYRLLEGDYNSYLKERFGAVFPKIISGFLLVALVFMVVFTMSLGYFRPAQPQQIKMLPLVNFLNQDQHDQWRYLTLGFGDQMAWFSTQTNATTVDGNYHSARRLPELTTRAIERLENSKFKGIEGIGSLQQFLTVPEKYHLKYIFSNDKFYDPILYFCGWSRLQRLENGIVVWEKANVPPLSSILPKEDVSLPLKLLWGTIPLLTVLLAFILNVQLLWYRALKTSNFRKTFFEKYRLTYTRFSPRLSTTNHLWAFIILVLTAYGIYHFYLDHRDHYSPENLLTAYYDALDLKKFEQAHACLDPESGVSLAQYMLEMSVNDGLLSSYAKLDSLGLKFKKQTKIKAIAEVVTQWITPLEKISQVDTHEVVLRNGKWYLVPKAGDNEIPPDQLFSENSTQFYNQGRRRITTQQTYHEDVLEQPALEVISAKLVRFQGRYAIIGELQNLDDVPADVVIKATLYNESDNELASFNAKYEMKHKLLPRETTPFKIYFEGVAWSGNDEKGPETYNPGEFTPVAFKEVPVKFNLQCAGIVATRDLYRGLVLQEVRPLDTHLEGVLFNSGVMEVTVPQLLVSYYDQEGELVWVDHKFLKDGVRVQRTRSFDYSPLDLSDLRLIDQNMDRIYINGMHNRDISEKYLPDRIREHAERAYQEMQGPGYRYLRFDLNPYTAKSY